MPTNIIFQHHYEEKYHSNVWKIFFLYFYLLPLRLVFYIKDLSLKKTFKYDIIGAPKLDKFFFHVSISKNSISG